MQRKRSVGKTLALGCGGLIVLLVVLAFAGCAILRSLGGRQAHTALARLKASGAPTTWEEAIPPPVPDQENAAILYEDAVRAMLLSHPSNKTISAHLSAATRQERAALRDDAQRIITDNAQALSYARQAAERPTCRFRRDWSNPAGILMPEFQHLKNLSKLACAQAVLRADRGDVSGALEAWLLNASIARHLESDPMLLGRLTQYAIIAIAAAYLPRVLEAGPLTPEECRRADQALARLDLDQAFIRTLETERAFSLWMVREVWKDPQYLTAMFGSSPSRPPSPIAAAKHTFASLAFRVVSPLEEAAMLRYWEKTIALARKPYRDSVAEYDTLGDDIPSYALVTRTLAPVHGRLTITRDKAAAHLGLMRTGLGLAAYRTQYGKYPPSLDHVRKALKWDPPEDPFSGKDFIYKPQGAGYLLYSFGQDLDDDGGAPMYGSGRAPGDFDIIWRVER